jgi:hypothetical protein
LLTDSPAMAPLPELPYEVDIDSIAASVHVSLLHRIIPEFIHVSAYPAKIRDLDEYSDYCYIGSAPLHMY